jgi:hypothetical protein
MARALTLSRLRWFAAALALATSACASTPAAVALTDTGEPIFMQSARDASPELRLFARQYVQRSAFWPDLRDYQARNGRRFSVDRDIEVGEADLDDDGMPERFLTIDNPLFCGATGCTTYVLQKSGRNWRVLLQNNVRAEIRVLGETDGGYHRLCMARLVEAWDGTQYQPIPSGRRAEAPPDKAASDTADLVAYVTCDDGDPEAPR